MFRRRSDVDSRSNLIRTSVFVTGSAAMALINLSASAQTDATASVPTGATAPLSITITPRQSSVGLPVIVAYCVRLCDGRYFPLSLAGGSPHTASTTLCKALCPASKTRIYIGVDIDGAFATSGRRYSSLATAFHYRKELVAGCTCNGTDVIGTAPIAVTADPTLRTGDIIATRRGLRVFTGAIRVTHRAQEFNPIENYPRLSASLRTKVKW